MVAPPSSPQERRAPWSEGEQRRLDWGEVEGGRQGRRRESGLAGAVGLWFEAKELDRSLCGRHGSWGDFPSCSLSPQSYKGAVDFSPPIPQMWRVGPKEHPNTA